MESQVGRVELPCDGEIHVAASGNVRCRDPHRALRGTRQ